MAKKINNGKQIERERERMSVCVSDKRGKNSFGLIILIRNLFLKKNKLMTYRLNSS